jgi:Reverse transcriptase (RNA-dependent DNA polymerase)
MSRLTHLYLLCTKDEAFAAYKEYDSWCTTQLNVHVKTLHSDHGGEYLGKEFVKSKGTAQKLTMHDTPQHNGVAKHRNHTIVEHIRALLHASGLPKFLWGEAAWHIVWLMNHTFTKAVDGKTPYEAVFGRKPNLQRVREWGEKVWVRTEDGNKLGGRVTEGRWVGIDDRSKGFRIYWPEKRTVTVEWNIYLDNTTASASRLEGEKWIIETTTDAPASTAHTPPPPVAVVPTTAADPANPSDSEAELPAKWIRKPSQRVKDILDGYGTASYHSSDPVIATGVQMPTIVANKPAEVFEGEGSADSMMMAEGPDEYALVATTSETEAIDPWSLAEAKHHPDWHLWETAIHEELAVLHDVRTWKLTEAPDGANIIGSKWVFRAKKDAAGNDVCYKAHLVAQGFSQVPGVDYFDTFAPVAKLALIQTVLALAAANDMELHQIDIKGTYLNGELTNSETMYMSQPPGYHAPNSSGKVCLLQKMLYGLKQSGRCWYQKLVDIISCSPSCSFLAVM